jgi:hypothetical protein
MNPAQKTFYNNGRRYDVKIGDILEVTDKCRDEDWKTVSVFPARYPFLHPGDKGKVVGIFTNYYGTYIKLDVESGTFDIDPKNLFYPSELNQPGIISAVMIKNVDYE